jgi:ASC-1-like (ASCH) protein
MVLPVYDRTPYNLEYYKDGQKQTSRRVPPPKLHDLEEGDEVTIIKKKGDDWDAGDKVEIKAINPRQPNTLTIQNSDEEYTFLSYDDVELNEKSAQHYIREGKDPFGSQYLLWP